MKRILCVLTALCIALAAAPARAEKQVSLCADFTMGSADARDAVRRYETEIQGEISAEALADALSRLIGLDFFITAEPTAAGLKVDWAKNSTLVAGLDDREQKGEFHMYDRDGLSWFMMDSLCATLKENLNIQNVYYTMNGGSTLVVEGLNPVSAFEKDSPYLGSAFYCAQSEDRADEPSLTGPVLTGNLPRQAQLIENTLDGEGGYRERLSAEEGNVTLLLLRRAKSRENPEEWTVERALQEDYPDLRGLKTVEGQTVSGYAARRARFETGQNEDARLVDALVFETEEYGFAFAVDVPIDFYYGLGGGYEKGELDGLIQDWMDSLALFEAE